jgi:uncharacterized protein (DUF1501 family)
MNQTSRRAFIRVGSLSLLEMSLSRYLCAREATPAGSARGKAQACILVYLEGGPSQVDLWDPKPNSTFRPISTNVAGIQISEMLPRMARQMDKVALIRSMHTEESNHPQGAYYAFTGHRPTAAMQFPSLGAIITKELGPLHNVPPHLTIPGWKTGGYEGYLKSGFLGPAYDPMVVPDPSQEGFHVEDLSLPKSVPAAALEDRGAFLRVVDGYYRQKVEMAEYGSMDSFTRQALQMILTPEVRAAFDLSRESGKTKDAYGRHSFGQTLLLSRRLVEGGSRFITAAGHQLNGWDTHSDNEQRLRKLLPVLDQSLAVLLEDLRERGLLDSTIVVVLGEFGRTPHVNSKGGRDHWPNCWSLLVAGGGLRGGQVIGSSDERGGEVADRMVSMGDLFATIYKAMGIDWRKEYPSPIGRPVKIANAIGDRTGEVIGELI